LAIQKFSLVNDDSPLWEKDRTSLRQELAVNKKFLCGNDTTMVAWYPKQNTYDTQ
jgi:hypothetical protein